MNSKLDAGSPGGKSSRRSTLGLLARTGAAAFFVPAWNETIEAADALTCVPATPTVTEGPYWVDEKLFRSDIRTDPQNGVAREGIPLTLILNVQNLQSAGVCTPLQGAYVDIWHCDAKGIYSDERTYNPGGGTGVVNTSGQKFLRGYQITDENGQVRFLTIYPGWYAGRTIHIHFRVRTYSGNNVIGNFVSQIFFDETINNAVLALASYARTTRRDTSNANDMVYQVANKERMLAATTGDTASGYTAAITVGVSLQAPTAARPSISAGGVTNAVSGDAGISPGSWVSIYGTNLAVTSRVLANSDVLENALPQSLAGVSVTINAKPAYVQYVSPTQINVLAPLDTSTGPVSVVVTNSAGSSNTVTAVLQPALPGLSVLSKYVRAVRFPDGAIVNGTGAAEPGYSVTSAVAQGDVVALYGTGFGLVLGNPPSGMVFSAAYPTANSVTVQIGGISADVLWAGLVGLGLYQINVQVPVSLPDGEHTVVASVLGVSSQATGALLKVAASAKLTASAIPLHRAKFFRPVAGFGMERIAALSAFPSVNLEIDSRIVQLS